MCVYACMYVYAYVCLCLNANICAFARIIIVFMKLQTENAALCQQKKGYY